MVPIGPIPKKSYIITFRYVASPYGRIVPSTLKIMEDTMDKPTLTHEARCLLIVAGGVLEDCIRSRARIIATNRSAEQISPEDVEQATAEFLREELSDLPHLVQQSQSEFRNHSNKAA